jgi:hypothetical protein
MLARDRVFLNKSELLTWFPAGPTYLAPFTSIAGKYDGAEIPCTVAQPLNRTVERFIRDDGWPIAESS